MTMVRLAVSRELFRGKMKGEERTCAPRDTLRMTKMLRVRASTLGTS